MNDSREFADEIVKQFGKVLINRDGFDDLQEGVKLRRFRLTMVLGNRSFMVTILLLLGASRAGCTTSSVRTHARQRGGGPARMSGRQNIDFVALRLIPPQLNLTGPAQVVDGREDSILRQIWTELDDLFNPHP